jgi:predicted RNase H-like HicB family nuclease
MVTYTACYTKNSSGYTGQLLEWPAVVTEGATIDECRLMLEDAAAEMMKICAEDGIPVPRGRTIFETISIEESEFVCQ